ncbi:MAG: AbrB/MazE/SpoVT family DNA-binding domain-containing protein [Pseudomonadota bacterium]|nr:AbrB/MazE/SpoVT family DNA-binding domain-containing protein [Burkholderiaceae bacterium]MDQ3188907.1 AbrB/MazE/SpoVT family DNA-binding domain-containing protein [Pseudomonadota bacterium]
MAVVHSKVTAQGQISVPAEVRKKLGIGPGSVLEWEDKGDQIVVRRAGRFTSTDVHVAVFPRKASKQRNVKELKEGIRKYVRKRHAGR